MRCRRHALALPAVTQVAAQALELPLDADLVALAETRFVVVDLETTGGSPTSSAITEIGAVAVRGGEVEGTFRTFVNPGHEIPASITVLTGITNAMVADAPSVDAALAMFLDFAGLSGEQIPHDTVLVAHNAGFDVGFLQAACLRTNRAWPDVPVLDTVRLARAVLTREEVANYKLGTLAAHVGTTITPNHRALDDAQATVDVLHHLIGRVGSLGITTMHELVALRRAPSPTVTRKRHLADDIPSAPGVYMFRDRDDVPLYVGVSGNLRSRVRTYFTAAETRGRMAHMVALAERVTPIVCQTDLEARVRELRLIAEYQPRYNRRDRTPQRAVWLTIDPDDAVPANRRLRGTGDLLLPGLRLAREVPHHIPSAGPFSSRGGADDAASVLSLAPDAAAAALHGDREALAALLAAGQTRMAHLAAGEHFEQAAVWRDRLLLTLRGVHQAQRVHALASIPELVAAQPREDLGWDLHLIRHGRLAGAATVEPGRDPRPTVDALVATGEVVTAGEGVAARHRGEFSLLLRWLSDPGTRLVRLNRTESDTRGWTSPIGGAGWALAHLQPSSTSNDASVDLDAD